MTTATMLETDVNALCESIYRQTGQQNDYDLLCGTALKKLFSSFAAWVPNGVSTVPLRRFNQDADSKAIINTVDFWQGDFRILQTHFKFVLSQGCNRNCACYCQYPERSRIPDQLGSMGAPLQSPTAICGKPGSRWWSSRIRGCDRWPGYV